MHGSLAFGCMLLCKGALCKFSIVLLMPVLFNHTLISALDLHNNILNLDKINQAIPFLQQLIINACMK